MMEAVESMNFPNAEISAGVLVPPFPPNPPLVILQQDENWYLPGRVVVSSDCRKWEIIRVLMPCIYGVVVVAREFEQSFVNFENFKSYQALREIYTNAYISNFRRGVEFNRMLNVPNEFIDQRTLPPCHYFEKLYVIKIMCFERINDRNQLAESPMTEISALQHISRLGGHQNVMTITAAMQDNFAIYLVLPFFYGRDLFDCRIPDYRAGMPENLVAPICLKIVQGLDYLLGDDVRVCHRDLSLENVLVDNNYDDIAVMDFGMAVHFSSENALIRNDRRVGKIYYMSPEVYAGTDFNPRSIDIFALGVMVYVMLTGSYPFEIPDPMNRSFRAIAIEQMLGEKLRYNFSEEAVDFMQKCLQYDPNRRATIQQLLQHPWLTLIHPAENESDTGESDSIGTATGSDTEVSEPDAAAIE